MTNCYVVKGDKKKLTKVFGHISALKAPTEKNKYFFQVPPHTDFEKVLSFIPGF